MPAIDSDYGIRKPQMQMAFITEQQILLPLGVRHDVDEKHTFFAVDAS